MLPENGFAPDTRRYLERLLWTSAGGAFILVIVQLTTVVFPDLSGRGLLWPFAVITAVSAVLGIVFDIVVTAYLTCALLLAIDKVNAAGSSKPTLLLEVNAEHFWRLLTFVALATAVFGILLYFPVQVIRLIPLVCHVNAPRSAQLLTEVLSVVGRVLEIAVFPAILFIVLEKSEWKPALWETVGLWRRHLGDWLGLLLPVLVLAFGTNFVQRWISLSMGHGPMSSILPRMLTHIVSAVASAWWLVTIVRWWRRKRA